MGRNYFLRNALVALALLLIPVTVLESCSKSTSSAPGTVNFTLDLTGPSAAPLKTIGGYVIANNSVIIIRVSGSQYNAFSATCTFAPCQVEYMVATNQIYCPCHACTYDPATGAVTGGPPPAGLAKYTTTVAGNILTVKS